MARRAPKVDSEAGKQLNIARGRSAERGRRSPIYPAIDWYSMLKIRMRGGKQVGGKGDLPPKFKQSDTSNR